MDRLHEIQLDVAISTWKQAGIMRVASMDLPIVEGVRYVVSWQRCGEDGEIPESLLKRKDVEIYEMEGKGLARNRNNAISHSDAEIVLIADDDLSYTAVGLQKVIDAFMQRPDMDVATFRYEGESRIYPQCECVLGSRLPKGYNVVSFEIAIRRRVLDRVRFDERYGIGSGIFESAEDDRFLYDVRKAGFHCRFIPQTITMHAHSSTGSRPMTAGVAAASGNIIRLEYPYSWPLRIVLKAWRKRESGFMFNLRHLLRGAFYSS